jgi:signal transduction histidine kinase
MRERLEMIGGTLAIESSRGKGTVVRAEVPFKKSTTPNNETT